LGQNKANKLTSSKKKEEKEKWKLKRKVRTLEIFGLFLMQILWFEGDIS
jgi:hypothetical protein